MIEITHTPEEGTLVNGTTKGDGTAQILRAHRFRWFPSLRVWGIRGSHDHAPKLHQINSAANALRAAGYQVTVSVDTAPRDIAAAEADRRARMDDRAEALDRKAERRAGEADAHLNAADTIAANRPLGQPILVGHHSERRARADQRRLENHMVSRPGFPGQGA